jgi:hypothetical protein
VARHDPSVAVKLIYQMFAKLLIVKTALAEARSDYSPIKPRVRGSHVGRPP